MTDFESLLPPRLPAPYLPHRGGPDAIKALAARRRKRKATHAVSAGSVASLVFAGLFVLRPPPGTHGVDVAPPGTHPPRTPGTSQVHKPATGPDDAGPTATASPTAPATRPTPTSLPSPTASPSPVRIDDDPPVLLETDSQGYTRIDRTFVPDPGGDCLTEFSTNSPGAVICTRTIAPPSLRPGQPARFVFQACAYGGRDQTLRFDGTAEARMFIMPNDDTSPEVWNARTPPGGPAHTLVIPADQCAQYTVHWLGRGDDDEPLPPGEYLVVSNLLGNGGPTEISEDAFVVTEANQTTAR